MTKTTKANEYIDDIIKEIDWFEYTYKKFPKMLIMSSALAARVAGAIVRYSGKDYEYPNGIIGSFVDIPLMVYPSSKLECHCVEHTFSFY